MIALSSITTWEATYKLTNHMHNNLLIKMAVAMYITATCVRKESCIIIHLQLVACIVNDGEVFLAYHCELYLSIYII